MSIPGKGRLAPTRRGLVKAVLKAGIRILGKGDRKVAAVFATDPSVCHSAVLHLIAGAPGIPIWLFTKAEPRQETAALCRRVIVKAGGFGLLLDAERKLWRHSVAISAGAWTGSRGDWLSKAAPLLVPPCRAVFVNENGDFLPGRPRNIIAHCTRRMRSALDSALNRLQDLVQLLWDLACAEILRILAASLKPFGYPDRRLFLRVCGGGPLRVPMIRSEGAGVATYRQEGQQWDGRSFESFVRSANSRWIVWRQDGGCDPVGAFAPLTDPRAFASSVQERFRDWDPGLMATAASRPLQPGEISQVLAPLSRTIVADRRKLLALGIPRCSYAWTAWAILFWKAAAAGWRSYSVGCGLPVSPQPEIPLQEREFIWRILKDSSLRRLGPREPDLARGNIAFTPGAAPPLRRDCPRVLVVSPFLPYPQSHGGAVRIYNLCRGLADRVDFALVAIHERGETVRYDKLHEVFQEIRIVDPDEPISHDRSLPDQVRRHESRSLRAAISDLASDWRPDLLQVEYTHMAAVRESVPEIPAILVEHDLTFKLYGQVADARAGREARAEHGRWLEFERRWLSAYDAVWTVSEEDRSVAVAEGSRPDRTFAVPNGVDVFRFAPSAEHAWPPEILFVGSFRHFPNVLAFEALRDEVMPRVWERFPGAVARVVAGPDHLAHLRRFSRSLRQHRERQEIAIHGFVEDLRPLYGRATVVCAPMQISAGTNIKMLEAMACGKAIVATPAACGGLGLRDAREALIRGEWDEVADAVCEVLSDDSLRQRIGREARKAAERRFSWAAIQEEAYRSYLDLMEEPTLARVASIGD